jgi:DNA excision repair protein ERCC-2
MYTAELAQSALRRARRGAPAPVKRAIARLDRPWKALTAQSDAPYRVLDAPPKGFAAALQGLVDALGEHFAQAPVAADGDLLRFYFEAMHFARVLEALDAHSMLDITRAAASSTLCVRNVVPAPFLTGRVADAACVVIFSATLAPPQFHRDMLGLPADSVFVDVETPFRAEQLELRIAGRVSTRWRDRERSLAPIADLMAEQFATRRGNYLAFFSSFDYMQAAADALGERHGGVPRWTQSRAMSEAEREGFLARFASDGEGIGFAVLGGAFAEGIDLPGRRLIGAFVATLGMPQLNPVNEEMRRRMQRRFGLGYEYVYFYPGMQKVVQAAGRVIRTEEDTGVVVLMDDRFMERRARALMPKWWDRDLGLHRVG